MITRKVQIVAITLMAMMLAIPLASAWEHEVDIWTDFDKTWEENTGDIRYDETTTYFSAPRSVRMKNSAKGWVNLDEEGTVEVTFRLRMRRVYDFFAVEFCTEEGNENRVDVKFTCEQQNSEEALVRIIDLRAPTDEYDDVARTTIGDFYLGRWVKITIIIGWVGNFHLASIVATDENRKGMYLKDIQLYQPMLVLDKTYFGSVRFRPGDNYAYIDDLKVSTAEGDAGWGPTISGSGVGIGGFAIAAIIVIVLGAGYYFNLMPIPQYGKGAIKFKRRKSV